MQIEEVEYLYNRETMRERELNKHTLLLSRGYKYRLDKLYAARSALRKLVGRAPTKEMNFARILREREIALEDAKEDLQKLTLEHTSKGVEMLLHNQDPHKLLDFTLLSKEIITQKNRVRGRQRSLDSWIATGASTKPRNYRDAKTPEADAKFINRFGAKDSDSTNRIGMSINDTALARDINWTPVTDAMTSAIDMLNAGPATKPEIDIDEQEVEDDIVYDDSIFVKTTPKVQID